MHLNFKTFDSSLSFIDYLFEFSKCNIELAAVLQTRESIIESSEVSNMQNSWFGGGWSSDWIYQTIFIQPKCFRYSLLNATSYNYASPFLFLLYLI